MLARISATTNNGNLVATGQLDLDLASAAGFDIASELGADGRTAANTGLASLVVAGVTGLYAIDPLTGQTTLLGAHGEVVDLAVPLNQ